MSKIVSQSGHIAYGIKKYVCDLESDINQLSISDVPGSEAFCIENGKTYILNNAYNWVIKKIISSESQDIDELEIQINDLNNQIKTLNSSLADANENIASLNAEIANLKEINKNFNNVIVNLEIEITTLNDKISDLEKKIEDLTPTVKIEDSTASIPENIAVVDIETNTLVLSDDAQIVGNTLILK